MPIDPFSELKKLISGEDVTLSVVNDEMADLIKAMQNNESLDFSTLSSFEALSKMKREEGIDKYAGREGEQFCILFDKLQRLIAA